MGRKLKTKLPTSPEDLKSSLPDMEKVKEKELSVDTRQKYVFDKRHNAHNHPELNFGDPVWIKDRKESRVVQEQYSDHFFIVKT